MILQKIIQEKSSFLVESRLMDLCQIVWHWMIGECQIIIFSGLGLFPENCKGQVFNLLYVSDICGMNCGEKYHKSLWNRDLAVLARSLKSPLHWIIRIYGYHDAYIPCQPVYHTHVFFSWCLHPVQTLSDPDTRWYIDDSMASSLFTILRFFIQCYSQVSL